MNKEEKQKVVNAIRKFWDSAETHLDATFEKPTKEEVKKGETNKFHADTLVEYFEEMLSLAKLLQKIKK